MSDVTTESKPFWQSKTFWANAVAIVASVAGVFGAGEVLDPEMQATVVGVVMGVVNIVLRFVTDKAVTVS